MQFESTEDQKELQRLARQAASKWIAPIVEEDEEHGRFRPELIPQFGELGLCGLATPEEFGGAGLGSTEVVLMLEEIAAVSASYAISLSVCGLPQTVLNQFGSPEQKKRFLPKLATGQHIGAYALTESHSGSDAAALRTQAVRDGDAYQIDGTKLYITQGNHADVMVVFARTASGPKGISAFVIEKAMAGVRTGKLERKMGLNISPTCEMIFEGVRVPVENRIGNEGEGFKFAMAALDAGRIAIGSIAVGIARAALEYAMQYAAERKQFGQAISANQGIQFMFADMATELDAARLLVHRAAQIRDSGKPATRAASMAKLYATDAAMKITTDAVQILGGAGYMREYPVERYMREAKALQILEGTNQIQRVVIHRSLQQDLFTNRSL